MSVFANATTGPAVPALSDDELSVPSAEGAVPAVGSAVPPAGPVRPVELDVSTPHGDAVRRWVEGVVGWQPVDRTTSSWAPQVRLVDVHARAGAPGLGLPVVLIVTEEDDPALVAEAGAVHAPAAVVVWPADRDRLVARVEQALAAPAPLRDGATTLRVGGSAGGVGTTTVSLALAGLAAWRGGRVLVVLRDAFLATGVREVPADALAAPDLWEQGSPLPGVTAARAVRVDGGRAATVEPAVRDADLVLIDAGATCDVEVLVCRPDAAGVAGIEATTAAAIVVNGAGALDVGAVRRAAAPRRTITVPWSTRVARAGLHARIPAGLPGAWLRRLAPLTPRGDRRADRHGSGAREDPAASLGDQEAPCRTATTGAAT